MPRFHFNVYDGVSIPDLNGAELANAREARLEAIRYAGELMTDHPERIALGEDWRMEVTDPTGLILFHLDFSCSATAATIGETAKDRGRR